MSIFQYDEEKHLKNEREIAFNDGLEVGIAKGTAYAQEQIIKSMLKNNIPPEQISQICSIPFEIVDKIAQKQG